MRRLVTSIFLTACMWTSTFAFINQNLPYCFQYTWMGPLSTSDSKKIVNCSTIKDQPCIPPFIYDLTPPNTSHIWHTEDNEKMCILKPGNVCVKYTFFHNDGVTVKNMSSFCGQVIEDQTSAVTSRCYQYFVDSYTLEACACRTLAGMKPCNSSVKIEFSWLTMILSSWIVYVIFINLN